MFNIFKNKKGQVYILTVFIIIILLNFTGLIVDVGQIFYHKQLMQDGIDLACIAAGQEVDISHGAVVSTAIEYGKKNGIHPNELTITHPYKDDENQVELSATRTIKLFFAPIYGIDTKTITVRSVAKKDSLFSKYVIFSNSEDEPIEIKSAAHIVGHVHGNEDIKLLGSDIIVEGIVEAAEKIEDKKNATTEGLMSNGPSIPMPYFDIEQYRNKATIYYNHDIDFDASSSIPTNTIIFVDGNVKLQTKLEGNIIIFATGNIELSGSNVDFGVDSQISFLAGEDIIFIGSNSIFRGMFYTYNGKMKFNVTSCTIYGKFYCDRMDINSNKLKIIDTEIEGDILGSDYVSLQE